MPIPQLNLRDSQDWRKGKSKKKNSGAPARRKAGRGLSSWLSWRNLAAALALFAVAGALAGAAAIGWLSRGLPDPDHLISREVPENTKILDRTGETVLYEIHGAQNRTLIKLEEIPDDVKNATIAIEDKDFYRHKGFSLWAIFRTAVMNVLRGQKAGGSTLTQQFVKNAVLTTEKTYARKIRELLLAYKIEKRFTKDQIMQMYLNEVPYGSTAYGVEAASQRYFGKSVRDVNLAEAALLAALTQAPTRYSPYGSNRDLLLARQKYVIDLMVEQGHVGEQKAEAAKLTPLEFRTPGDNIIAPHFVMYVREILTERYGEKTVEQGGLRIHTTLDLYKQKIAEEAVQNRAAENEDRYNATNAALIALDPKNGQIVAMVGSRDYFNEDIDGQVNVTTRLRQPGSSLKPLVYAAAFLRGYTPDTVLYDVVTDFSNDPAKPYEPKNYDGAEHGPTTMRLALAGSLNIPAVKAVYLAGIDHVLNLAEDFGYTSLKDRDRFGLALVLGGGEIRLLEHAAAYGAFAREGVLSRPAAILKVEDRDGRILEEFSEDKKQVIDPKVARQINDILSDNQARSYVFGEASWLTLGARPVAAKTGTTNDYRDGWTMGYTPSLVAGVWVGNNNNAEMKRGADGSKIAAPIWNEFMKRVLGDTPVENFRKPESVVTGKPVLDGALGEERVVQIDRASGLLATEFTPPHYIEEIKVSEDHCILYYVKRDDPRGAAPADPADDPQFELWENRVLAWAEKEGRSTTTLPDAYDNVHLPENRPRFEIETPQPGAVISEALLTIRLEGLTAPRGVRQVEYLLNGHSLANTTAYPFNREENLSFLANGFHTITARACDDIDNCAEKSVDFNLRLETPAGNRSFSASWLEPANGVAVTHIDFPLLFKLKLINPRNIARLNLFYLDQDNEPSLITAVKPENSETLNLFWPEPPASGSYRLFAEAVGWNATAEKTKELIVNVSNPNQADD